MRADAPLLIVANCGRALAQSARRDHRDPVVLDRYADLDTCASSARCERLAVEFGALDATGISNICHSWWPRNERVGVVYGGGLERCPALVRALAVGRVLYGNPPELLEFMSSRGAFFGLLRSLRIAYPEVRCSAREHSGRWLRKALGGSGGSHVARVETPCRAAASQYLQRYVPGQVVSAIFLADGRDARIVGYNTLWQAGPTNRALFAYGGALNRAQLRPEQRRQIVSYIGRLVRALGLRGLNGIDCVIAGGKPLVIDLNPRPCATIDLYDSDIEGGLVALHIQSCTAAVPQVTYTRTNRVRAHAIIYAPRSLVVARMRWPSWTADRPRPGTSVTAGQPLCTVLAAGESEAAVRRQIAHRSAWVRALCCSAKASRAKPTNEYAA